jgi:hypothetical protein
MDLQNASATASFNPFAVFLQLEGGALEREFYGLPFISDPPYLQLGPDRRWATSTIHHELTHLASIRVTHLGWVLGVEAARLLREFRGRSDPSSNFNLHLSDAAACLLGIYLPLLEGLALYAELHFDERAGERILSNPVPLHAQMAAAARMTNEAAIYRVARDEACFELHKNSVGLLRLLFCDTGHPEHSYYLVGYLWIRAAAELIARHCARLGRPAIMLPLLIKLLCDHPIIEDASLGKVSASEIIAAIRDSIFSLTSQSLERVDVALDDEALAKLFEHWKLHGFLRSTGIGRPDTDLTRDAAHVFPQSTTDPQSPKDDIYILRALTSVWISGASSGYLVERHIDEASNARLVLMSDPASEGFDVWLPSIVHFGVLS